MIPARKSRSFAIRLILPPPAPITAYCVTSSQQQTVFKVRPYACFFTSHSTTLSRSRSTFQPTDFMMKTLQNLALQTVPNPGLMARTFPVPWRPLTQKLEAREYEEQRNKFLEQHRVHFRYVCREFCFIKAWYSTEKIIYPSNVAFLDKCWIRSFGSKIYTG